MSEFYIKNMLLLSSQSFPRYGLERFFDFAKKAGYKGVEISVNANYDTQNVEYLKARKEVQNADKSLLTW